jgi:hypothetical protein
MLKEAVKKSPKKTRPPEWLNADLVVLCTSSCFINKNYIFHVNYTYFEKADV